MDYRIAGFGYKITASTIKMVLLNLDARLKSLPLPFGRGNKNNTGRSGGASKDKRDVKLTGSDKHKVNGLSLTAAVVNGAHLPVSRALSAESVNSGNWSPSISEALLNYALVGPSIQLACGTDSSSTSPTDCRNILSQTLPASYQYGGSTTSLSTTLTSHSPVTTRSQRSHSTMEYRPVRTSKIRRRLTLNPTWKAVSPEYCLSSIVSVVILTLLKQSVTRANRMHVNVALTSLSMFTAVTYPVCVKANHCNTFINILTSIYMYDTFVCSRLVEQV